MLYAVAVVAVLIIDQIVKYWTNTTLAVGEMMEFIPGFIGLTHYQNTGAAFGFLKDVSFARWLFVALVIVFSIIVIYLVANKIIKGAAGRWMLVLVMAGAIGNGIDRVINGYVIDMFSFEFMEFAVFNVADIFVTVCGLIFCLWLIFHKEEKPEEPEPRRRTREPRRMPDPGPREDYLTQLSKPVSQARHDLDRQRAEASYQAASTAREDAIRRTRQSGQRQPFNAPPPIDPNDPFAEFLTESRAAPQTTARVNTFNVSEMSEARPAQAPAQTPFIPAERPQAAPARTQTPPAAAPAAAPKKSDTDFTLDDILAEFSGK